MISDLLKARTLRGRVKERPQMQVQHRRAWRPVPRNQTGIKRLYLLGELDGVVKTPWGARAVKRRRARNKVAKQSRKANRRG